MPDEIKKITIAERTLKAESKIKTLSLIKSNVFIIIYGILRVKVHFEIKKFNNEPTKIPIS